MRGQPAVGKTVHNVCGLACQCILELTSLPNYQKTWRPRNGALHYGWKDTKSTQCPSSSARRTYERRYSSGNVHSGEALYEFFDSRSQANLLKIHRPRPHMHRRDKDHSMGRQQTWQEVGNDPVRVSKTGPIPAANTIAWVLLNNLQGNSSFFSANRARPGEQKVAVKRGYRIKLSHKFLQISENDLEYKKIIFPESKFNAMNRVIQGFCPKKEKEKIVCVEWGGRV